MSNFLARPKWQPVVIIDRRPKRRTSADVIAMVVSLAFLLAMVVNGKHQWTCRECFTHGPSVRPVNSAFELESIPGGAA